MAANAPPSSTTRPVSPSPSDSSAIDGPVVSVINKRLRALRKKHNRIIHMEESVAQGKVLNKAQEETLRSKTVVVAQIEELEKLKQPLAAAVGEEHSVAVKKFLESEKDKEARVSAEEEYVVVEEVKDGKEEVEEEDRAAVIGVVGDVLNLLYFGSIFDVKTQSEFASTMLTRTHERGCCLTYDYVTDDAVDVLREKDLDFISNLGSLLTSRPMDSSLSHKDALERCVEHAKLWLAKSEQPIGPASTITYAELRERLNKIMASEYFTTTPEMKAPVDVAASAAGNYRFYQVPGQGSSVAGHDEGNVAQYEHWDEVGHYQGQKMGENEFSHSEEAHKEVVGDHYDDSYQQEQGYKQKEVEHKPRESEQYMQGRGNQNQRGGRGGGRRGYSNARGFRSGSRGGGPYHQNAHNQYYDQPGNYYPRNNYYNGRGRGGRGTGGHGYSEYGARAHAGHPSGDTGMAS